VTKEEFLQKLRERNEGWFLQGVLKGVSGLIRTSEREFCPICAVAGHGPNSKALRIGTQELGLSLELARNIVEVADNYPASPGFENLRQELLEVTGLASGC